MLISVIIPMYNSENTILKCLLSIKNQTYNDFEVIIINDGSTDHSEQIVNKFIEKDNRFKLINQDNFGPGMARNKGIKKALGKYLIFIDSDDYVEKNYFKEIYKKDENNPDVIMIDIVQENEKGKILRYERMSDYQNLKLDQLIKYQMTGKIPWGGCRKCVKKDLLLKNNILFNHLEVGEEAIFSFDVLYKAQNITFLNTIVYHYVNYPNSQSKKGNEDPWRFVVENLKEHIIQMNCYNEFENTINSFALTSLTVSLDRISTMFEYTQAKENMIKIKSYYENKYNMYSLDENSLEKKVSIIKNIVLNNRFLFFYFISKSKNFIKNILK